MGGMEEVAVDIVKIDCYIGNLVTSCSSNAFLGVLTYVNSSKKRIEERDAS